MNGVSLTQVCKELNIRELGEPWCSGWEASQNRFEREGLDFLKPRFFMEVNHYLQLPEEVLVMLQKTGEEILNNETLARFTWHCSCVLYAPEERNIPNPPDPEVLGELSGMFSLVVLLSGMPDLNRVYKEKGIPEQVAVETLSDIRLWMKVEYEKQGIWRFIKLYWIARHLKCRLFRLGRLQFELSRFRGELRVYRNKETKEVIALSEAGIFYRKDGLVDGTNGIYGMDGVWEAGNRLQDGFVSGNPISPYGFAVGDSIKLDINQWELVLEKGDRMLNIHIPAGSKMEHEQCGESFARALQFFAAYFPEFQFKGFSCTSWLLEPQFQKLLPMESNIVKFQREYYLYPVKSEDSQVFEKVFGAKPENMMDLPEGSTLQAVIKKHYLEGNWLHQGGMFLLKEDLQWGAQVYQRSQRS